MKNSIIYYNVGPLLYCPASSKNIAHSIAAERFGHHFSLALCLEDTIADDFVLEAENQVIRSLQFLKSALSETDFYLPQIFIRVRDSEQIFRLFEKLGSTCDLLTGLILPKFSLSNADAYLDAVQKLDSKYGHLYLMPVIESPTIVNLRTRSQILYSLKEKLDAVEEKVLNVRVGGNDLCNVFGLRRQACESIYELRPVADILSDIMTVFGPDYVLSGPVWEYYNGANWKSGLAEELSKDKTFGFVGKTVIHPKQISLVNQAFSVSPEDYQDALDILKWNPGRPNLVSGGSQNIRMNEYKTHYNWALRIKYLADSYGICPSLQEACR